MRQRDVIAIADSSFGGVGWDHAMARVVVQQPRQEIVGFGFGVISVGPLIGELLLDCIKSCLSMIAGCSPGRISPLYLTSLSFPNTDTLFTCSEPETSRRCIHAGCKEEATRGAPKDHPSMDEAFKGQATVNQRNFRFRQDGSAAERERVRSQSPQSA